MMVAKVRRVVNPRRSRSVGRPVRRRKTTASRPKSKSHRKRNGPKKKKLSAKQIKFFGTKRQKAALKRRRSKPKAGVTGRVVRRKSNPTRKTASRPVVVIVKARAKRKASRKPKRSRNPIQAVTLGFLNPHKGRKSNMARRRRRRVSAAPVRRRRRRNTSGRRRAARSVSVIRRNTRRRSTHRRRSRRRSSSARRNPNFFGSSSSMTEMLKYIGGGLAGVAITKAVVPMLPASLRSSQAMAVASSLGVAIAAGWAASKIDPKVGSAVMFGGLMQTASVFLNAFVPSIGGFIGLSGGRGVGDFVPARFPIPQNPILQNGGAGVAMGPGRAYLPAY